MRVAAAEVVTELDTRKRCSNGILADGASLMRAQDIEDPVAHAERWIERAPRILGDIGDDLSAQAARRAGALTHDRLPADMNAAARAADAEGDERDRRGGSDHRTGVQRDVGAILADHAGPVGARRLQTEPEEVHRGDDQNREGET